jgi:hypothetical protein
MISGIVTTMPAAMVWVYGTMCGPAVKLAMATVDGSTASAPACSSCSVTFDHPNDGAGYTYELSATNRENQTSPVSGASSPIVYAQGQPGQPTNLQVSPHDSSVQASFTVPAANGPAISQVNYQAKDQSGSASASGTWTGTFSSGSQSPTETISSLSDGHAYVVTVQACNQEPNGQPNCGPWSASSGAVTPCCSQPNVSAQVGPSVQQITFSWSDNGQPVHNYSVCIQGSPCSNSSSAGSVTNSYGCNQTVQMTVTAYNNFNEASATSTTQATTGCATSVTISWSSAHPSWAVFTLYQFQAGTYTYYCEFQTQSQLGPYTETVTGGSSETIDNGHTCADYDGPGKDSMWVHYSAGPSIPSGGMDSNHLVTQ